ncbi:hypothetical protein VP1G_11126 [Cytospora mali]|uniref:Uncharacterized protein n=1 Tax=Cytospora mali TaxID=578113 RepID=A0A194V6V8_CYTMA|nr:hypothetical protein VP1G_11126 [Valsa mali var. pyri (nom. inval.)]
MAARLDDETRLLSLALPDLRQGCLAALAIFSYVLLYGYCTHYAHLVRQAHSLCPFEEPRQPLFAPPYRLFTKKPAFFAAGLPRPIIISFAFREYLPILGASLPSPCFFITRYTVDPTRWSRGCRDSALATCRETVLNFLAFRTRLSSESPVSSSLSAPSSDADSRKSSGRTSGSECLSSLLRVAAEVRLGMWGSRRACSASELLLLSSSAPSWQPARTWQPVQRILWRIILAVAPVLLILIVVLLGLRDLGIQHILCRALLGGEKLRGLIVIEDNVLAGRFRRGRGHGDLHLHAGTLDFLELGVSSSCWLAAFRLPAAFLAGVTDALSASGAVSLAAAPATSCPSSALATDWFAFAVAVAPEGVSITSAFALDADLVLGDLTGVLAILSVV